MSSIAPPPAYPTWPPQQPYPPAPQKPRRRWPALAAAAGVGAIAAGLITTLITVAATPASTTAAPVRSTVTETAGPPTAPAPLPAAQADAQTCSAWGTADTLFTAAATAQGVIPPGMTITDPAVQSNPTWKAGVLRASSLYAQAADTFESHIAEGTDPMLAQVADTTVSSLRTLSESYKSFDPANGTAVSAYQAGQKAMNWLCR